jgi:hypothetical protein
MILVGLHSDTIMSFHYRRTGRHSLWLPGAMTMSSPSSTFHSPFPPMTTLSRASVYPSRNTCFTRAIPQYSLRSGHLATLASPVLLARIAFADPQSKSSKPPAPTPSPSTVPVRQKNSPSSFPESSTSSVPTRSPTSEDSQSLTSP